MADPGSNGSSHPGELSEGEYELFRGLVHEKFGISLAARKRTLLSGRLARLMARTGHSCPQDLYTDLARGRCAAELQDFANSVTTNYTYFDREPQHFEHHLKVGLPEHTAMLQQSGQRDLRVWCAAASSGEEPYCLAMLQREHLRGAYSDWSAGVLATDISEQALAVARAGIYTAESGSRLPGHLRTRYMQRLPDGRYQVKPAIQQEVTFRRLNLMRRDLPFRQPFHTIFCRNVMIYFDQPTRDTLIRRLHEQLAIGGYLYIGLAETIDRATTPFRHVAPGIYRREN